MVNRKIADNLWPHIENGKIVFKIPVCLKNELGLTKKDLEKSYIKIVRN